MTQLQTQQLSFTFDRLPLFQNLSLSVQEGSVLHIVGANGIGKTTLLRLLAGTLVPTQGSVLWDGQTIECIQMQYRQELIYLGSRLGIKAKLTVLENLLLQNALMGGSTPEVVIDALNFFNLFPHQNKVVETLSTGMQRRVGLSRLLIAKRKLWLLDEPWSGLDREGVACLAKAIAEHVLACGIVIFTSHQSVEIPGVVVRELSLCH